MFKPDILSFAVVSEYENICKLVQNNHPYAMLICFFSFWLKVFRTFLTEKDGIVYSVKSVL